MKQRKLNTSRYTDSYENRDKGGIDRQGIIKWPSGDIRFFKPKMGKGSFHIIPYEIKSKLHPIVASGKGAVGDLDFALDIWVHRYVGPAQADIVCLKKNYGKLCPICEEYFRLYAEGKKEEGKKLRASRRVFLNIIPEIDGAEKHLEVFEVSHYLFLKELMEEAHACAEGSDIIPFADLKDGKLISFRVAEGELEKTFEFKSFHFLDRKPLDDEWIDKAISFDEHLLVLSPAQIEQIMYGQDEVEKEAPAKSKPAEDEEEEEAPAPSKSTSREESPAPAKKGQGCPHGHSWGEADKHRECRKCNVWDACSDAS